MGSISSSFDVTPSGTLESFLTTTYSNSGVFSALGSSTSSGASKTAIALGSGGMTNAEHNVITTIGSGPTSGTSIAWNKDGSEPTTLANMRSYGWIKLVNKTRTDGTVTGGVYQLTAVGKAILKRAGGAKIGSSSSSSSSTSDGVSAATKKQITSAIQGVEALLAGLGGSSSSSTSGVSTGTTNSSAVNILV